jgi:hypothetical protein
LTQAGFGHIGYQPGVHQARVPAHFVFHFVLHFVGKGAESDKVVDEVKDKVAEPEASPQGLQAAGLPEFAAGDRAASTHARLPISGPAAIVCPSNNSTTYRF